MLLFRTNKLKMMQSACLNNSISLLCNLDMENARYLYLLSHGLFSIIVLALLTKWN